MTTEHHNNPDSCKCVKKNRSEEHKFLIEQLSAGYKQVWENKTALETKAGQIISISSIMGTVIFGFSAIIFSTSTLPMIVNRIDEATRHTFFTMIIASMITAIVSIIMGLRVIKIRDYQYIIGGNEHSNKYKKKEKIINEFKKLKREVHNGLLNIKLADFLIDYMRHKVPDDFTKLVTQYFEKEDKDSLERNCTFEQFSKSKIPWSFKKNFADYWEHADLNVIMEDFMDDYAGKCLANFAENESKGRDIQISYYLMVITLVLVSIALALLFL
jgi:hypothetical protein